MSDSMGQRQGRNQGAQAPERPSPEKFSEAQLEYVDQVTRLQAAAATDPFLNGEDARRRLHSD